jgi:hypothetical protein
MNGRKRRIELFFYLHLCDNKAEQRQKKKFIFSLSPFFTTCGQIILLAVGSPVSAQAVSEHTKRVCHIFFELYYLLLDKRKKERIERKKK